jgi:hypothetical protein
MTHTKADLNLILRELERQYSGDGEMARRIRFRIAKAVSRGSRRGRSEQRRQGLFAAVTAALVALACVTAGRPIQSTPLPHAMQSLLSTAQR